jgi:hypothetical protein
MPAFEVPVERSETLARYIFSRRYLGPVHPKAAAFMPPPDLKLSVFRIDDLSQVAVWAIGVSVGAESQRHLHGRGDIFASQVLASGLTTEPDNVPERHVSITGWPDDESKRLSIAQELANSAVLHVAPSRLASE